MDSHQALARRPMEGCRLGLLMTLWRCTTQPSPRAGLRAPARSHPCSGCQNKNPPIGHRPPVHRKRIPSIRHAASITPHRRPTGAPPRHDAEPDGYPPPAAGTGHPPHHLPHGQSLDAGEQVEHVIKKALRRRHGSLPSNRIDRPRTTSARYPLTASSGR